MLMKGMALGVVGLMSQLILHGMLRLADDFPEDLLWFTAKKTKQKNQIVLNQPVVGRKIKVFGLQMAHEGILIYSVLWCNTAESNTPKGAGCVQVNWYHI